MTEIRGLQVLAEGTYVLMEDVVAAIREYAQSLDDPNLGGCIHDLASWLIGEEPNVFESEIAAVGHEPITPALTGTEVHGAESDDVIPDVDRIEVYPVETERGLRWHARSIDTGGFILKTTNGSFDQTWVISNAEERWPGIPVHVVSSASDDSKWTEDGTRGVFPSKGPPVRRLFAGVNR